MSTPETKKKKKTKVYSEAFPPNSLGSHEKFNPISDTHSLLSSIQIDPTKIYYKPLSQDNLIEIQNLHKEWFPIDYQKKFFETILTHQSSTYFLTVPSPISPTLSAILVSAFVPASAIASVLAVAIFASTSAVFA